MEEGGFEPPNPKERFYRPSRLTTSLLLHNKWRGTESNRRHTELQSVALPTELPSHLRSVRDSNSWSHPWQGCVLTKTRPTDQNCGGWIWTNDLRVMSPTSYQAALPRDNKLSDPCGIRTHDTSVKGWCLNRLTNGSWQVTRAGFEPTIPAWKAGVLTTWLTGHNGEWEIRTLAPLSRPTPLAGAPLQPLE